MNFRNISAWSIRNPIVPIVLFLMLTLGGMVAFSSMKVQNTPDVEFPMVLVSITQPGAAPSEVEKQITQRVESSLRTIAGVDTIQSTAAEGNSQTYVMFKIGNDINAAVNEVKNAIDQARGDLPDGILEPQVIKLQTSAQPIAFIAVAADDMTIEQLSWFVDDTVAKRLLSISGMAAVQRSGGVDREIAVTLDPMRMQSLGVTASQVNGTLRQVNLNAAGGRAEVAGSRQSVRVLGNAKDAFALSQTEISLPGGRTIKLADIASVSDGNSEATSIAKINGKPAVTFSIARARGESDVSVYDETIAILAKLEKEQGHKVRFTPVYNSVDYTKAQYETSMAAMVEGAVLAVIVVFFFLRDWRATIVSALAIPLSAIPTFMVMSWLDFTLNQMSLMALGLVAGVLVDDAIVEIENIVRHMRMGKTAYQASIDAADEIGLAVVATTLSIVAVFLPVGLMPGIPGQFFKNFGLTVVVAVLFSLAVARMITPMVAAYFLESKGHAEHGSGKWMDRYMVILHWSLDSSGAVAYRAANSGRRFAHRLQARLRDHRVWMIGIGVAALALTAVLLVRAPKQFFPDSDSDYSIVRVEMVPGTTLAQTENVVDQVYSVLHKQQEVKVALQSIREGGASIFINFHKHRERDSITFERQLTPILQRVPDARVTFQELREGGPNGGGSGRAISVMLSGSNPDLLAQSAQKLVEQMGGIKELVAPRVSGDLRRPEIVVTPNMDLAASLGVSTQALSQVIRIATQGEIDQNSAKFSLDDRQVPIRVKLPISSRRDLSTIANLPVPTANGGSVPLSRLATISFGSGPTTIQRYNLSRRIFVGADLRPGAAKGDADVAIQKLPIMMNLPEGVSNSPAGADRWQQEMVGDFIIALSAGIVLVFSVLVLLYRRVISPLVNMGSLFLAPLGGMLLLAVTGQVMSLPVFIGLLMLFGIVAKNSILLIDFAIEEMATGRGKLESIIEAGHKRAQPIVMTTVAMIAGMIPTALAIGGDSGWRAPMGTVVIGGLALSTALTLLIVPAAFSLADGLEARLGPKMRRMLLTYKPEHGENADYAHHEGGAPARPPLAPAAHPAE